MNIDHSPASSRSTRTRRPLTLGLVGLGAALLIGGALALGMSGQAG